MIEIKAPSLARASEFGPTLFLAGSIEQGAADKWQRLAVSALKEFEGTIYNPRRDDWDSSWEQRITNPQFRQQVEWEVERLTGVDIILMHFDPKTRSPITLLEFGVIWAMTTPPHIVVSCPPTFWRRGNIEVMAALHKQMYLCDNLDRALRTVEHILSVSAPKSSAP